MNIQEKQSELYKTVGLRIKERRKSLRITQAQLAELMDISYQQVQKYETGLNSISLERLMQFATLLNAPPNHFYQGVALGVRTNTTTNDIIYNTGPRRIHLLLVEDNMADLMLFRKSLGAHSDLAELYCLSDPEKLMDYLIHHSTRYGTAAPDVIILDLNMPRTNGLKIMKDLKNNSQTCTIPVIIFTNSISKKELHEAYRLGAAGFIQKSIDADTYQQSVETLILYWSKVVTLPQK